MDWVPIVFVTFKMAALSTAMYLAIKWHYDQSPSRRHSVLRAGGMMLGAFILVLLIVGVLVVALSKTLGLDLGF